MQGLAEGIVRDSAPCGRAISEPPPAIKMQVRSTGRLCIIGLRTFPSEISSLRSDISAACGGQSKREADRHSSELGAGLLLFCGGDEIRTRGTVTRTAV